MAELIVSKLGKTYFKYPLTKDEVVIGRSMAADVVLPDEEISRRHAVVNYSNHRHVIRDTQSSAGVFFNGRKVELKILEDADEIAIGPWILRYVEHSIQDDEAEAEIQTNITRLKDSSATRIYRIDPVSETFVTREIVVTVIDATGTHKKNLKKGKGSVGAAAQNDIVLSDDYASSRHLQIEAMEDGFKVIDLNSTNGTIVKGQKIRESVIQSGEEILIGKTHLILAWQEGVEKITPHQETHFCGLVGQSPSMRKLFAQIERVAATPMTVLIQAETGCGKELVARSLHDLSGRRDKPYVVINCGAIASNLIESELFGHEKGAFTGAQSRRVGAFEEANEGTLFLDEVAELPLELQPKLLRALENRTIKRVGHNQEVPVDVRVIAATHRNLAREVKEGRFREDLYYRLFVIPLSIPPLRERREDISLLANYFLKQLDFQGEKQFLPEALAELVKYDWPGNVRELKNIVSRALVFSGDEKMIGPGSLSMVNLSDSVPVVMTSPTGKPLEDFEKQKILEVLQLASGNKTKAAQMLGIAKSTLFKKLHDYGLMDEQE